MKIKKIEKNKKRFLDLLLLGDESEFMIDKYLNISDMYVMYGKEVFGVIVVSKKDKYTIEIKNLAIDENYQKLGYGRKFIDFILNEYSDRYKRVVLGTGESPLTLGFYKKLGFREYKRVENFFTDNYENPIIEDGVILKDMIYLEKFMDKEILLKTDRLYIRKLENKDLNSFIDMHKDKEVMKYFPSCLSEIKSISLYKKISNHFVYYGYSLFAIEDIKTGNFVGYVGFLNISSKYIFYPGIEIGWKLRKEYWHLGYAHEAASKCIEYGFNYLDFEKIYAFTYINNKSSRKLMERLNMKKIGYFTHPLLDKEDLLSRHVLYAIDNYNNI